MAEKYAGADHVANGRRWVPGKKIDGKMTKGQYCDIELSPLGIEVADILGQVWRGIYHLQYDLIDWSDPHHIEVNIAEGLSTWDFNRLTELVVLCHDRAVRLEIEPCNMRFVKLLFHQRGREGGMTKRHPTMEEAVQMVRDNIGLEIV